MTFDIYACCLFWQTYLSRCSATALSELEDTLNALANLTDILLRAGC
ncbi:hypothetical protein PMI06_008434 [Burkholderia sp. BT03]|nr:hypothetical protein PMI06_008434 [Burkholderia sp. BT03]SKC47437.1 hypothetical protein SAMN06266956_0157 [Paraburkholderia hospita]